LGTHPDSLQQVVSQTPLTYWQPETPFQFNKTYYWKVNGYINDCVYSSLLWNFTTIAEYISPPQNLSGFYNGSAAQLSWSAPKTIIKAITNLPQCQLLYIYLGDLLLR
jgi:hypothetical protein